MMPTWTQTVNPLLYNTFSVSTDLNSCYLEVGNGNEYPEQHYRPSTEATRAFRDVLKFVHGNNEYSDETLQNRNNFGSTFPFVYFDLTKRKLDIKDGTTKFTFKYELPAWYNSSTSHCERFDIVWAEHWVAENRWKNNFQNLSTTCICKQWIYVN